MTTHQIETAIVGGGPCGLLTGLLLGRQRVRCRIYERHPGISRHPKAMGVSRRSAEIFRQLGLAEEMRRADLPADTESISVWAKTLVGELLGKVPMAGKQVEETPERGFHSPQTHTEEVLLQALAKVPDVEVCFLHEVIDWKEEADRVILRVRDLDTGREEEVAADWMVAADGAGSEVRHRLGIEADGPGDMGHFLNTFFRADYGRHLTDRKSVLYQALSEEYFEAFVAVNGDDLWLMHHFLQPGETPEDYPAERLKEIIQYTSGLPDEPVEILGISPWVMSPKIARSFRKGRIFLAGDAAARLSPAGGLGLNTGMQSVHNLAWKLAEVIQGRAGAALLDTYETERRAASLFTMENTGGNAQEIFEIIGLAFEKKWEEAKDRIRHSRRGGIGLGQDLGLEYESTAVVPDGTESLPRKDPVNDYVPQGRPGCRAPHLWIRHAGHGKISTLDLFGQELVLLAGHRGKAWRLAAKDQTPLRVYVEGEDFDAPDTFRSAYGIDPTGAVLVRPDGYVGWRSRTDHPDAKGVLKEALNLVLARA